MTSTPAFLQRRAPLTEGTTCIQMKPAPLILSFQPTGSPAEVKIALDALAARQPDPYVVELPRAAGCKENRFAHALGEASAEAVAMWDGLTRMSVDRSE